MVIQPVDKPQAEPIRVAYDRVRHCSELLAEKFWPTRATKSRNKAARRRRPIIAIQMIVILIGETK